MIFSLSLSCSQQLVIEVAAAYVCLTAQPHFEMLFEEEVVCGSTSIFNVILKIFACGLLVMTIRLHRP